MLRFIYFIALGLISMQLHSQVLSGTIKDESGKPVPFSTVYIRELSLGTAANEDGNFELQIPAGKYVCVFQSLGYQPVLKNIELSKGVTEVHIVLQQMIYDLSTVVISGKEDPAYRIMRKVIAKAPGYANMVKSFDAEVYIKGSLFIRTISKLMKWMAKDDLKEFNIKEGDTYVQESVNRIEFTAPNLTRQKVISIKSTFPDFGEDQSNSAIGFIAGNIYRSDGFGAAYSPILPGAFKYYDFRYEGKSTYENTSVHRIAILPKGKGSQYVQGTIYIVDGLWCISNLDIFKEEQLGVKLFLTQNYNEVQPNAWLPVSNKMKIELDLMGNSGSFNYHTSIRYNKLTVNAPGKKTSPVATKAEKSKREETYSKKINERISKKQKTIEELQSKENPSTTEAYRLARLQQQQEELRVKDSLRFNHEFIELYKTEIDTNARKQDTSFWNKIRPIPLSGNELKSIRSHDSIVVLNKPHDSDSVYRPGKNRWIGKLIFGGSFNNDTVYHSWARGLINPFGVSFNLVDGWRYNTFFLFERFYTKNSSLSIQPNIGYAFNRKALFWECLSYYKDKRKNLMYGLRFGQQSFDYNPDGIHPLESTIEALVFRENPARFYHATYLETRYERNLINDFSVSGSIYLAENKLMNNVTDYSFFFKDNKEFEPNIPENLYYRMRNHQDLSVELSLKYKPVPFYYIKDGVKVARYRFSDTPEFSLTWRKGIPSGSFDTDYDVLKFAVQQQKHLGSANRLNYMVETGYFINTNKMWFTQFKHFSKRPLIAGVKEFFPYFLLLDSYKNSTNNNYVVSHVQYKSPFIALKRLPVLRNRLWTESLFFSYLYTHLNKNYTELGYGIGSIIFNLGFFVGFEGANYNSAGLRMAITIFGSKEISL